MITYLFGHHPYQWSLPPLGVGQRVTEKTLDFTFRGLLVAAAWGSLALTAELLGKLRGRDDYKNHAIAGGVFGTIYSRFLCGPGKFELIVLSGFWALFMAGARYSGWVYSPEGLWVRREADFTDYYPESKLGGRREMRAWWKNKGSPW